MDVVKQISLPVWLGLMVVGFLWFWPVGLAVLALLAWSGLLGNAGTGLPWSGSFWSSGNKAFDAYQAAERKRLEDERAAFDRFVDEKLNAQQRQEFNEFKEQQSQQKAA